MKTWLKLLCAAVLSVGLLLSPNLAEAQLLQHPIASGQTVDIHQCSLPILYNLYSEDQKEIDAIEQAIFLWNETVGYELFKPAEYEDKLDLIIGFVDEDPPSPETLAYAKNHTSPDGCVQMSLAVFFKTSLAEFSDTALIVVAAHELGHVLGLSHSFDRANLMYPTAKKDYPFSFPELNCTQRKALARYIPVGPGLCKEE